MPSPAPYLSVIVPILDEAGTLPHLFHTLARQQRINFELILSDGGSSDATIELARELAQSVSFPCLIIEAERGRAQQLNAGAAAAKSDTFLFLHADSLFSDPLALRTGLTIFNGKLQRRGDDGAAGRFSLRFQPQLSGSLAYYFYECKARLNRDGCIHGDQGFLLRRSFFQAIGPFDDTLPILEDDRMAARIRQIGEWILLPGEIFTSTRRFETEGLKSRQTLNALLMNFAAIGWNDFFTQHDFYQRQSRTGPLRLYSYFAKIRTLLLQLSLRQRWAIWYRTGAFVRDNAWQIPFALDARCNYYRRLSPGEGTTARLDLFDRWLAPLIPHPPAIFFAAVLTWCWFRLSLLSLWRQRNSF